MAACPHLLTGQPGLSSNYASSLGLFLDPDTNYMHKLASFNRGRGSSSEVALWASNRWTRVRLPAKLDGCFMPCIASLPWSLPLKLPLWHQCVSTNASAPALPRNDDSAQESIIFHFPTCAPSFPVFPSFCLPASQSLPNLTLSGPICAAGGWLFPLHYPPFGLFSLRRRPRPPLSLPLCFAFAFAFSPASAKFASASQHFTVPFLSSSMCPCVHVSISPCPFAQN